MNQIRTKRTLLPTLFVLVALLAAMLPAALFAAPVAQADDEPLYFVSGTIPAASSPGRQILLTVNADETAILSTDFLNDEDPIVEEGTWEADDATQTLTVTLTGNQNGEYDEPTVLVFEVDDEGTLTLDTDASDGSYGSAGLTLFFSEDGSQPEESADDESPVTTAAATDNEAVADQDEEDDATDPSGVYVSNILPAADTPGQVVFMILYPDGVIQADTYYLNQEAPISETGTWTMTTDSEVLVTITGTDEADYDQPQELEFTWDGETLQYLMLRLNRIEQQALGATPVAWYTTGVLPAASSPGLQMSLVLYDDGSVNMVNDYMNDEDPIIEVGTWEVDEEDGTLTVTLTGQVDGVYEEPDVLVFSQDGDELTAIEKDETIYGNNDLVFTEQSLDDLPEEAQTPAEADDDVDAGIETSDALTVTESITGTGNITGTGSVTGTDSVTSAGPSTDDLSALLSDELANFQAPIGATAVYVSDFMPSASTPGRVVALILYEDGTTEMLTDYLTGDSPFSEVGTWEEDADGNLTVTLTGPAGGQRYATPDVIVFAPTATGIEAVDYDQSVYGSEGLTLNQVGQ